LELVAASRDLFLERAEVTHHHLHGRRVRIRQVHWPDRKLLAHEIVQEAHTGHQTSIHLVGLRFTAEDLVAIILDRAVLDLDNPIAFAQQVEDQRQRRVLPAGWFEQDQEVGRGGRVFVQVTRELGEARGIAQLEADGLHPTPSIGGALSIEYGERTRGCDVLAIAHVDADVDPFPIG